MNGQQIKVNEARPRDNSGGGRGRGGGGYGGGGRGGGGYGRGGYGGGGYGGGRGGGGYGGGGYGGGRDGGISELKESFFLKCFLNQAVEVMAVVVEEVRCFYLFHLAHF